MAAYVVWRGQQEKESLLHTEAFHCSLNNKKSFMFKFQLVVLGQNVGDQLGRSSGLLLQTSCNVCNVNGLS